MFKMENDPRIIPIGHFLRKTSIDEFPQFWNVFKRRYESCRDKTSDSG